MDREAAIAWRTRTLPEVQGHGAVKAASKDWARFSSDLQGDADVRAYRQLPLEVDPPAHGAYRDLLLPFFGRVQVAAMEPGFRDAARDLVARFVERGHLDAVEELALPMVLRGLAVAFRRPQDLATWTAWGVETWIERGDGTRDGAHLDAYLDAVVDEAMAAPDPNGDVFARLAVGTIDGRPLTRDELLGLTNLVLAGGRDTVVKLICAALWHLARTPADLAALRADPAALPVAIEEWLRWMSPLPRMERELRETTVVGGVERAPGERVMLSFVSANHDPAVFADAASVHIDRRPNHHIAFGNGPHTCVGAHLAKVETRIFLEELLAVTDSLAVGPGEPVIDWHAIEGARLPGAFRRLPLTIAAR